MQKIVERDVVTTCAQGKRELDICKSRETFNFGSIFAPLLLSLSTKGVAQPALKNKVLGKPANYAETVARAFNFR